MKDGGVYVVAHQLLRCSVCETMLFDDCVIRAGYGKRHSCVTIYCQAHADHQCKEVYHDQNPDYRLCQIVPNPSELPFGCSMIVYEPAPLQGRKDGLSIFEAAAPDFEMGVTVDLRRLPPKEDKKLEEGQSRARGGVLTE